MTKVYVSIGSNTERDKNILAGLSALEKQFGPLTVSSIYESAAVGFVGQAFFNLVVGFDSQRAVTDIANTLRNIELAQGRIRREGEKSATVSLDLDLLLYGDLIIDEGDMQIPREEITHRAFVLQPLAEIAPTLTHPVSGKSYGVLWQQFDKSLVKQQVIESFSKIQVA
jgi:2-amino-4-hydroxy-6-hydroxymethyldihydropteridine diphosphokinase